MRFELLQLPIHILGDHRQCTLCEIAEAVGEFSIHLVYKSFCRIAAVLAEGYFCQKEVAQRIDAECFGKFHRVGDIPERLRFLHTPVEQEAMAEHLLRQRQIRAHQESRPVDRVETNDVLADQVQIGRPELVP